MQVRNTLFNPFTCYTIYGTDVYQDLVPIYHKHLTEAGTNVYKDLVCIYSKHLKTAPLQTQKGYCCLPWESLTLVHYVGKNVEFFNGTTGGVYSYHYALNS